MWQRLTWRIEVLGGRMHLAAIGIGGAIVLFLVAPMAAPYLFGARGDLLALVSEWAVTLGLGALFGLILCFVYRRMGSRWRWAVLSGSLFFTGIAVFATWEELTSLADLVLPFDSREIALARTYYEEPQSGRGALPETGGWHLVTNDGKDYRERESASARKLQPGTYEIELSHFKHLVMRVKQAP